MRRKSSLKAVLLHNSNDYPSHATNMRKLRKYDGITQKNKIFSFLWNIAADLKVIATLTGLQRGYTKFCGFLCECDSRANDKHYGVKNCPRRPI